MPPLINRRRAGIIIIALFVGLSVAWIFWNRPRKTDMSQFAPIEGLAFVEANDLSALVIGIEQTNAWQALAAPLVRLQESRLIVGGSGWLAGRGSARLTQFFSRALRSPWFFQALKEIRPGTL